METGSDILFFWVARMAMLCEEVMLHNFYLVESVLKLCLTGFYFIVLGPCSVRESIAPPDGAR